MLNTVKFVVSLHELFEFSFFQHLIIVPVHNVEQFAIDFLQLRFFNSLLNLVVLLKLIQTQIKFSLSCSFFVDVIFFVVITSSVES